MNLSEIVWGLIGFLLTVMVLSYLIGDNLFFRLAGYLFVGVMAGFLSVVIIRQILWPYLLIPLVHGSWLERLWALIPLGLVILLVLGQFKRFTGFSRYPLAFLGGVAAALAIGGAVFGTIMPQTQAVIEIFDPVVWYAVPGRTWLRIIDAVVMLLGTIGTLSYFHFGRQWRAHSNIKAEERPFILETLSGVGQVFIGIALGAVFAGLFSSALVALIDRILSIGQFILLVVGAS